MSKSSLSWLGLKIVNIISNFSCKQNYVQVLFSPIEEFEHSFACSLEEQSDERGEKKTILVSMGKKKKTIFVWTYTFVATGFIK